jgi:hypothetical protein
MYYELWGTNAKTWKQLFASHYPEHEELDMQELIKRALAPSLLPLLAGLAYLHVLVGVQ